jgi:hypothetical protein
MLTFDPSRILGSQRHRIPDPQHCTIYNYDFEKVLAFIQIYTPMTIYKNVRNSMYTQCCGSMTFWCGSGSPDPCLWLMRIRILLVSSLTFKMPTKNKFFKTSFCGYYFLKVLLHHFSKVKSQKEVAKQCWGSGSVGSICVEPGSGSVSTRYGSESFYHQASIVRKTLIPPVLWFLCDFSWCKCIFKK